MKSTKIHAVDNFTYSLNLLVAASVLILGLSGCGENNEQLQKEVDRLTAELDKYKADEARVKHNLSLMTKADVSLNERDWEGFNEVY